MNTPPNGREKLLREFARAVSDVLVEIERIVRGGIADQAKTKDLMARVEGARLRFSKLEAHNHSS
jgi:hypothetical protein